MTFVKVVITLVLVFGLISVPKEKCKCVKASEEQQTSWGQENVIIDQDKVFKSLRGKVVVSVNDKPLDGVLVEVYDKPEGLLMDWKEREARKADQRRIAACVTAEDGEFCFADIPPGKYELRSSKPKEWNATSVLVIIAPKDPKSTSSKLIVPLQVSQ